MPAPITHHYVGYLNHTIDDRWMAMAPIDTNIHLHGYEGPESEENIFLSTLSTPMHACEYHITIPRTQPAGTYMYHPHSHGSSDAEVALGLDGVWIVEPDETQLPRSAEHVIMLRYRIPLVFRQSVCPRRRRVRSGRRRARSSAASGAAGFVRSVQPAAVAGNVSDERGRRDARSERLRRDRFRSLRRGERSRHAGFAPSP